MLKVSVAIANYKQDRFQAALYLSIHKQDYKNIEISWFTDEIGIGTGEAFNKAIEMSTGDIIVLMCADDVFVDNRVISDIVKEFENEMVGHVSRYYYQFLDGETYPVRAWRGDNVIELANNPSGLAFRIEALEGMLKFEDSLYANSSGKRCRLENKMFVEAPSLVSEVLYNGWHYKILPYDTVAVRVHASIARSSTYYHDRWTSSPVEEYVKIGGDSILKDFTSLIQIKNYFTTKAVWKEIRNYAKLRPMNLLNIGFWFFAGVSLFTPRFILRHVPHWYRVTWGRWTTRVRERESS